MNYFGGMNNSSCCGCSNQQFMPFPIYSGCGCGGEGGCGYSGGNNSSYYAIILVLFILLVIVIGSRFNN